MASGKDKLGEAYVEIRADDSKLSGDMDNAEQVVDQKSSKMGDDVKKKVGGGFKGIGDSIEGSTEGMRKFSGAISSTVGIATGLLGSFVAIFGIIKLIQVGASKITESFKKQSELAPDLTKALENQAQNIKKIREETVGEIALREKIKELSEESANVSVPVDSAQAVLEVQKAEEERLKKLVELRKQYNDLVTRLNREALEKQSEEAEKISEKNARKLASNVLRSQLEQLRRSLLEPKEQIELRYDDLFKKINSMSDQLSKDEIERFTKIVNDRKSKELDALKDTADAKAKADKDRADAEAQRIADKERQEIESIQRQADALERAMTNALKTIAGKQTTGGNLAVPIKEVGRRIEAKIDSLKFGG